MNQAPPPMPYLVVFLTMSIAVRASLSSAVTSSSVTYRLFLKDVSTAAFAPRAFSLTQIKAKDHHKFIPKLFHVPAQPPSFPPPLFLHPAPGHVLFIGISPQSAVLIVHLCRSRGAECNMAPVIICAHCVPALKKYLTNPYGAVCRLAQRRG